MDACMDGCMDACRGAWMHASMYASMHSWSCGILPAQPNQSSEHFIFSDNVCKRQGKLIIYDDFSPLSGQQKNLPIDPHQKIIFRYSQLTRVFLNRHTLDPWRVFLLLTKLLHHWNVRPSGRLSHGWGKKLRNLFKFFLNQLKPFLNLFKHVQTLFKLG